MAMEVSWLLILATLVLDIIAFGLALGAESRRSKATVEYDIYYPITYCKYSQDVSTGLGVGAFFFLLFGQILITVGTRCLCNSASLKSGRALTLAKFLLVLSWLTFIISEICLVAGASRAAYRTKSKVFFGTTELNCETLRRGIFSAAAAFAVFTLIFSEGYYLAQSKAQDVLWQPYDRFGGSAVGMTSLSK
ncbi:hypothetical protein O6H91_02G007500 [Diphasiastrum complanatum]|uniref:Uncharacterized protein n=1 Tax=Diphasiastrum complanatum TaxID=34168 RepID=A0ACC2ECP6_DIPCM|nr:hypothetical protein O6H91_02G007500 [Diphasiastrum complanatum]